MTADLSQLESSELNRSKEEPQQRFLGREDKETENRFGEISMSPNAVNNINRLSQMYAGSEIGGLLAGWEEGGKRHIADTLVYIPEDRGVGQFEIMQGVADMMWALERMKENPAYAKHELEVLGWWHTHPSEKRAQDGSLITAHPPVPGGQRLGGGEASGDMGVNKYFSELFKKPQEMLIVKTINDHTPVELALWRWDNTKGSEEAAFQSGLRIMGDGQTEARYWDLPSGGQKIHKLNVREEDIIKVDVDDEDQIVITRSDLEMARTQNPEIVITVDDVPEETEINIELQGEEGQEEMSLDLKDLYKPGFQGKLDRIVDVAKVNLAQNIGKLRELKSQLTSFLRNRPEDSLPEVRIEIEEAIREIEDLDQDQDDVSDQIKILD